MRRVMIVGTSGSGKTTLARAVSARLGIPHTELDALRWQESWTPTETGIMREKVASVVKNEAWVIDGNYSKVQPLILARADTLIWLDYGRIVGLSRLLRRTLRRVLTRESLWGGCRETWKTTLSRDSILLWAWTTHPKNRVKYARLSQSPEAAHVRFVHLQTPAQTAVWLETL